MSSPPLSASSLALALAHFINPLLLLAELLSSSQLDFIFLVMFFCTAYYGTPLLFFFVKVLPWNWSNDACILVLCAGCGGVAKRVVNVRMGLGIVLCGAPISYDLRDGLNKLRAERTFTLNKLEATLAMEYKKGRRIRASLSKVISYFMCHNVINLRLWQN